MYPDHYVWWHLVWGMILVMVLLETDVWTVLWWEPRDKRYDSAQVDFGGGQWTKLTMSVQVSWCGETDLVDQGSRMRKSLWCYGSWGMMRVTRRWRRVVAKPPWEACWTRSDDARDGDRDGSSTLSWRMVLMRREDPRRKPWRDGWAYILGGFRASRGKMHRERWKGLLCGDWRWSRILRGENFEEEVRNFYHGFGDIID